MRRLLVPFAAAGLLLVGACGGSADADDAGEKVGKADVTPWPLTVAEGELQCHGAAVTITADGTEYALNGAAKSEYADLAPVWKDNPKIEGTKVPVTKLLERGQQLCD